MPDQPYNPSTDTWLWRQTHESASTRSPFKSVLAAPPPLAKYFDASFGEVSP
jgi:hypothetical protein